MSSQSPDLGGMTINERLFTEGLSREFEVAIQTADRHGAIAFLKRVALSEDDATATVDAVLQNPSKYGYKGGP